MNIICLWKDETSRAIATFSKTIVFVNSRQYKSFKGTRYRAPTCGVLSILAVTPSSATSIPLGSRSLQLHLAHHPHLLKHPSTWGAIALYFLFRYWCYRFIFTQYLRMIAQQKITPRLEKRGEINWALLRKFLKRFSVTNLLLYFWTGYRVFAVCCMLYPLLCGFNTLMLFNGRCTIYSLSHVSFGFNRTRLNAWGRESHRSRKGESES